MHSLTIDQQQQHQQRLALCVGVIDNNVCQLIFADDLSALTICPRFCDDCRVGQWFAVVEDTAASADNLNTNRGHQRFSPLLFSNLRVHSEDGPPFPTRVVGNSFTAKQVQVQLPICFLPDLSLFGWSALDASERKNFYLPHLDGAVGQVLCPMDWRRIEPGRRYDAFLSIEIDSVCPLPKWTLNSVDDLIDVSNTFSQNGALSPNLAASSGVVLRVVPEMARRAGHCSVVIRRRADGRLAFGLFWHQNLCVGDTVDFVSIEASYCSSSHQPVLFALDIAKSSGSAQMDDVEHVHGDMFILRVPLSVQLLTSLRNSQIIGTMELVNYGTLLDPNDRIGQHLGTMPDNVLLQQLSAANACVANIRARFFMLLGKCTPMWVFDGIESVQRTATLPASTEYDDVGDDNAVEQHQQQQQASSSASSSPTPVQPFSLSSSSATVAASDANQPSSRRQDDDDGHGHRGAVVVGDVEQREQHQAEEIVAAAVEQHGHAAAHDDAAQDVEVAEEVRLETEHEALVLFTHIVRWDVHMCFFIERECKFTSRRCCHRQDLPSCYESNDPPQPGSWAHILYTDSDTRRSVQHIVISKLCPPVQMGATLRFAMQTVCPSNALVWEAFLNAAPRACTVHQLLAEVEAAAAEEASDGDDDDYYVQDEQQHYYHRKSSGSSTNSMLQHHQAQWNRNMTMTPSRTAAADKAVPELSPMAVNIDSGHDITTAQVAQTACTELSTAAGDNGCDMTTTRTELSPVEHHHDDSGYGMTTTTRTADTELSPMKLHHDDSGCGMTMTTTMLRDDGGAQCHQRPSDGTALGNTGTAPTAVLSADSGIDASAEVQSAKHPEQLPPSLRMPDCDDEWATSPAWQSVEYERKFSVPSQRWSRNGKEDGPGNSQNGPIIAQNANAGCANAWMPPPQPAAPMLLMAMYTKVPPPPLPMAIMAVPPPPPLMMPLTMLNPRARADISWMYTLTLLPPPCTTTQCLMTSGGGGGTATAVGTMGSNDDNCTTAIDACETARACSSVSTIKPSMEAMTNPSTNTNHADLSWPALPSTVPTWPSLTSSTLASGGKVCNGTKAAVAPAPKPMKQQKVDNNGKQTTVMFTHCVGEEQYMRFFDASGTFLRNCASGAFLRTCCCKWKSDLKARQPAGSWATISYIDLSPQHIRLTNFEKLVYAEHLQPLLRLAMRVVRPEHAAAWNAVETIRGFCPIEWRKMGNVDGGAVIGSKVMLPPLVKPKTRRQRRQKQHVLLKADKNKGESAVVAAAKKQDSTVKQGTVMFAMCVGEEQYMRFFVTGGGELGRNCCCKWKIDLKERQSAGSLATISYIDLSAQHIRVKSFKKLVFDADCEHFEPWLKSAVASWLKSTQPIDD